MKYTRYRFYANDADPRPVKWPAAGPYWITGYSDDFAIVVAFLPAGEKLTDWWPEASNIEKTPVDVIEFSERFQKPDWWNSAPRAGKKA